MRMEWTHNISIWLSYKKPTDKVKSGSFWFVSRFANPKPKKLSIVNKSVSLPESLDWRTIKGDKNITPVINQGGCDNDFAVSTRKLLHHEFPDLRPQHSSQPFTHFFGRTTLSSHGCYFHTFENSDQGQRQNNSQSTTYCILFRPKSSKTSGVPASLPKQLCVLCLPDNRSLTHSFTCVRTFSGLSGRLPPFGCHTHTHTHTHTIPYTKHVRHTHAHTHTHTHTQYSIHTSWHWHTHSIPHTVFHTHHSTHGIPHTHTHTHTHTRVRARTHTHTHTHSMNHTWHTHDGHTQHNI